MSYHADIKGEEPTEDNLDPEEIEPAPDGREFEMEDYVSISRWRVGDPESDEA